MERFFLETVRRPLIENGVLKNILINQYYAKKLDCALDALTPATSRWQLVLDLAGLIGHVQNGLLIERSSVVIVMKRRGTLVSVALGGSRETDSCKHLSRSKPLRKFVRVLASTGSNR